MDTNNKMDANNKSQHILNTSATLLGLCFIVLTSLQALKLTGETLIDEFTTIAMFLFMVSCLLSFLSLRSRTERGPKYESVADYIFLSGLLMLFLTTILLACNLIK